jgi:protein subunit release factor B
MDYYVKGKIYNYLMESEKDKKNHEKAEKLNVKVIKNSNVKNNVRSTSLSPTDIS